MLHVQIRLDEPECYGDPKGILIEWNTDIHDAVLTGAVPPGCRREDNFIIMMK